VDGGGDVTGIEDVSVEGVEIRGDEEAGGAQFGEGETAQVALEVSAEPMAADETTGGGELEIQKFEKCFAVFDFSGEFDKAAAVKAGSPECSDVSSHAATGDCGDGDAIFFEDFDDTNVSEATGTARGEGEADFFGRSE
jgi:hypothetical protein